MVRIKEEEDTHFFLKWYTFYIFKIQDKLDKTVSLCIQKE